LVFLFRTRIAKEKKKKRIKKKKKEKEKQKPQTNPKNPKYKTSQHKIINSQIYLFTVDFSKFVLDIQMKVIKCVEELKIRQVSHN